MSEAVRHYLRNPDIRRLALCKVGANRQRIFLVKDGHGSESAHAAMAMLIKEPGRDWRTAYVPVAVPHSDEDPGMFGEKGSVDVWEPDEIAKAAHGFMAHGAEVVAKHFDSEVAPGVKLVENAVALADFKVGDTLIKEGTWYVGLEFDGRARELVDAGEIDAVSVEGFADRVLAKSADEDLNWVEQRAADESWPPTFDFDSLDDAALSELAKELAPAAVAKDAAFVPNKPGVTNWVQQTGGLPKYIADIAGDLITERGKSVSNAIQMAIGIVRNWCRGQGNVNADTRAKACAAVAEFDAKRARAKADNVAKEGRDPLLRRMAKALGIATDDDDCGCGDPVAKGLPADGGTVEDMEIGERVEQLEGQVKAVADGLNKLTAEDGVLAKLAAGQEEIAKKLPEPEPTEPTPEELKDALAKAEESIGKLLSPLAERIEALESGDSTQTTEPREPVAKSGENGKGSAAGIFFD